MFEIGRLNSVFPGINLDRFWRCRFGKTQNQFLLPNKTPLLSSGSVQFGQHSLGEEGKKWGQCLAKRRPRRREQHEELLSVRGDVELAAAGALDESGDGQRRRR